MKDRHNARTPVRSRGGKQPSLELPPLEFPALESRKHALTLCLLLGLCTMALYSPVGGHPFVNYDDPSYVTENPHIQAGLTWGTLRWALTSTDASNWHPVTWLSHAADYELFGMNASGHHWSSVLL